MIQFNLNVCMPGGSRPELTFVVRWPKLPGIEHTIDIAKPGEEDLGRYMVTVTRITHWLGCGEIDVYCEPTNVGSLTEMNAWYDRLEAEPDLHHQNVLGIRNYLC